MQERLFPATSSTTVIAIHRVGFYVKWKYSAALLSFSGTILLRKRSSPDKAKKQTLTLSLSARKPQHVIKTLYKAEVFS